MRIGKNLRTVDQRTLLFRCRSAGQAIDDFRERIRLGGTERSVWETRLSEKGFRICLVRVWQLAVFRLP
mgnify:CR=1 FL=1